MGGGGSLLGGRDGTGGNSFLKFGQVILTTGEQYILEGLVSHAARSVDSAALLDLQVSEGLWCLIDMSLRLNQRVARERRELRAAQALVLKPRGQIDPAKRVLMRSVFCHLLRRPKRFP